MWSGSRSNAWRKHTLSFQRTRSGGVDGGNGDKATPAVRVSSASRGLPEQGTEHLPKREHGSSQTVLHGDIIRSSPHHNGKGEKEVIRLTVFMP